MTASNPHGEKPAHEDNTAAPFDHLFPDGPGVVSFRNVRAALHHLGYRFAYDRRARRAFMRRSGSKKRYSIDARMLSRLRVEIIDVFGFDPRKEPVADVTAQLAYEKTFDPVCQYLKRLRWDKRPRIDTWLTDYFGVKNTPLARIIGKIVLVAAVRRARKPGCKFDEILVLIGPQGGGKSGAIAALAVKPSWFSDQEILTLGPQQQQEMLDGIWIYELGELGGFARAAPERVKAFLSRQRDRARRAYGHFREDTPRMCIFIATTNDDQFLKDTTGNRRFWPFKIRTVQKKKLKRDVAQIWAEAAELESSDFSIRLPKRYWKAAERAQNLRVEQHGWVATLAEVTGELHNEEWRVPYSEIFEKLKLTAAQRNPQSMKTINYCMECNGWRHRRKPFKFNGKTVRGFVKPKT